MSDNVMRTYTTLPSLPQHYVQYDQGEDRWLCTLLLKQGWRVEYSAACDSFTACPEVSNCHLQHVDCHLQHGDCHPLNVNLLTVISLMLILTYYLLTVIWRNVCKTCLNSPQR